MVSYSYEDSWSSWTTSSTTATPYNSIWESWNTSTTTSSSRDLIWYSWTSNRDKFTPVGTITYNGNSYAVNSFYYGNWVDEIKETIEQRRARRAQAEIEKIEAEELMAKRLRLYKELEKKRDDAEKKAQELLLDFIGPEQLKVYERTGRLFVQGNKYGYIIKKSGGVQKIDKKKIHDLCVYMMATKSGGVCPPTDHVIGLKLHIEADEGKFLKTANVQGQRSLPDQLPEMARVVDF